MIGVCETQGRGRGIVAGRRFTRGEVIERAPVVVLTAAQYAAIQGTLLVDYCFGWGTDTAFALGHFMLYNHSYAPNARCVQWLDEHVVEMVALRDIEAGEEIFWNYNGDPEDDSPLWFEVDG